MYGWLAEALEDGALVVTANRRLAGVLSEHYAQQQLQAGNKAWPSPAIRPWPDWVREELAEADISQVLPARLTSHQSRVLWEQCLRQQIPDPLLNIGGVVGQARDAWQLMHDYCVPLEEVERAARGRDQGVFVRAARAYRASLADEDWTDDAAATSLFARLLGNGAAPTPDKLVLAGFDRQTPAAERVLDALRGNGCRVSVVERGNAPARCRLTRFEDPEAELRAAGAWARRRLTDNPQQSVAIVAMHLERDAGRSARLVREGLAPGWQLGGRRYQMAVNVSYGQRLSLFPVIATALLALRWLHEDIRSTELSRLLRSDALGPGEWGERSRMELELRRWPDMQWSPERARRILYGNTESDSGWARILASLEAMRGDSSGVRRPSGWAMRFDEVLQALQWPGEMALDSVDFQLHNRWRELLNELARLDLVIASLTLGEALGRLRILAGETIFQPENREGLVQLLGPLEAAGMEFDHLLVCGLSSANWPPPGRPAALLSRDLQREHAMPDADPGDTLAYARRVLLRLAASGSNLACSFPLSEADAEQQASGLLAELGPAEDGSWKDPGWYAQAQTGTAMAVPVTGDEAPPVAEDESVTGGATTVNYQLMDPFSAFAFGRLGVRPIAPIMSGLPPNIRGSIIHRAVNALYHDRPTRAEIETGVAAGLDQRLPEILRYAFGWLEGRADPVLRQLLELEKRRVGNLLRSVVDLDLGRSDFRIAELEVPVTLELGNVKLGLRIDRVDSLAQGGGAAIIDYKTGRRRQFLNAGHEPTDGQLVAYTMALDEPVAELAFMNIDSRRVDYAGAGRDLTPDIDWDAELAGWQDDIRNAMRLFEQGDVRINGAFPAKDSRSFALLSRVRELQHGH
ncbi:MAG: PD-(D/E)XK nuclease family protein [Woeseiaceae bacterium]|nr:PD-(D/E)XK nuclease family protein [Woeseiaceae bacterium]